MSCPRLAAPGIRAWPPAENDAPPLTDVLRLKSIDAGHKLQHPGVHDIISHIHCLTQLMDMMLCQLVAAPLTAAVDRPEMRPCLSERKVAAAAALAALT
jgi:hypothetical protein